MVYIVETNTWGLRDFTQEEVFNTYEEAYEYLQDFMSCHANELEYRLYEARDEWTAKRKLLLEYK